MQRMSKETRMRTWKRVARVVVPVAAACLLLTGVLNGRAYLPDRTHGGWAADPFAPSGIDRIVDAPVRPPTRLDDLIANLQDALRSHSDNGTAAAMLGDAYLQKARETGDPSYYPKAEALYRQALDRNPDDFVAMTGMGTLSLARHDFRHALTWSEQAHARNPYHAAAFGVIADAQIELGRYDQAVQTVQAMVDLRPDLPSFSRVSYVRELLGDVPGAIAAMRQAAQAGSGRPEHVAWAQAQLGNLSFGAGDVAAAEQHYLQSLQTLDGYVFGVAGLAKVAAARGDFEGAIASYRAAIAQMPLPEFVIALGDVYAAAGKAHEAAQQYALVQAMQSLYEANGVDTDLEMALFAANHGLEIDRAVERARAGYEKRPSIHAADVLSWTLYKTGRYDEAWRYAQEALRLGTRDAMLHFHAGMIAAALGLSNEAINHLERALTINPYFSVLESRQAVDALASLRAGGSLMKGQGQ
jgi:tetratricopeptide (TPR) repeat protein